MSRSLFRFTFFSAVFLVWCGIATAEEKKEPSPNAQEAAKLLKKNLAKFRLTIQNPIGKGARGFVLVTDKDLPKAGPKADTFVISEKQAEAVIDGLVAVGQFDKPTYIPPPGAPVPGWYLSVGLTETPRRAYQWRLGDEKYELTADASVGEVIKMLEGDAKKALQALAKSTAK